MKMPRNVSGQQLIKALGLLGYETTRQTGSHVRLESHLLKKASFDGSVARSITHRNVGVHTLLDSKAPFGLLPQLQARLLARTVRGEMDGYIPCLVK